MEPAVGSESMGETRPGERIRRGSIRPTKFNPDLELCGELGTELGPGFGTESGFFFKVLVTTAGFSGLGGGTVKEQHHDDRRRVWELVFRR